MPALGAAVFWKTLLTSVALSVALRVTAPKPKRVTGSAEDNPLAANRDSVGSWKFLYGRMRVGGTVVTPGFAWATAVPVPGQPAPTSLRHYLAFAIVLAACEIDAVETVYFDDKPLTLDPVTNIATGANFGGDAWVIAKTGAADQVSVTVDLAGTGLYPPDQWTDDHRLRGLAYLWVVLKDDSTKFPGGVPNVSALIRGKKVYDPRTDETVWSSNAALCIADYLASPYGGRTGYSGINQTQLIAAANACEEQVELAPGGVFENRYECHGVVDTEPDVRENLEALLSSMGGDALYQPSVGEWFLYPAVWRAPSVTFTEKDVLDEIVIQACLSRAELFNTVHGSYARAANNYATTEYPQVTSSFYRTQDNGDELRAQLDLPFTTSDSMAQRLAKLALERHRQQMTCSFSTLFSGYKVATPDTCLLTIDRYGWDEKPWEIFEAALEADDEFALKFALTLRETTSAVFDWNFGEETQHDLAPNTNLPGLHDVYPGELGPAENHVAFGDMDERWDGTGNSAYTPVTPVHDTPAVWTDPDKAYDGSQSTYAKAIAVNPSPLTVSQEYELAASGGPVQGRWSCYTLVSNGKDGQVRLELSSDGGASWILFDAHGSPGNRPSVSPIITASNRSLVRLRVTSQVAARPRDPGTSNESRLFEAVWEEVSDLVAGGVLSGGQGHVRGNGSDERGELFRPLPGLNRNPFAHVYQPGEEFQAFVMATADAALSNPFELILRNRSTDTEYVLLRFPALAIPTGGVWATCWRRYQFTEQVTGDLEIVARSPIDNIWVHFDMVFFGPRVAGAQRVALAMYTPHVGESQNQANFVHGVVNAPQRRRWTTDVDDVLIGTVG